ncbi:hypothetical protein PDESU_05310 [Pontiella desulfatans]|uniref:Uncharacterized protein n=1 Tax=Pontiella desulfatans TaxID=2750659 RepID=A0A6C2UA07_PONDE|nr:hypothetical protein [Pontiella desulfatans]VGO16719.1 hypothetical protein PDESU_05310 [Pontiella desulfatans]
MMGKNGQGSLVAVVVLLAGCGDTPVKQEAAEAETNDVLAEILAEVLPITPWDPESAFSFDPTIFPRRIDHGERIIHMDCSFPTLPAGDMTLIDDRWRLEK